MAGSILIVEDSPDLRLLMQRVLELQGYEVFTAINGEEGLREMEHVHPCLVILDLMMPVMNGWEFFSIKNKDPNYAPIPVVICSAIGHAVHLPGAQGFLHKPMELDEMLETVEKHCGLAH